MEGGRELTVLPAIFQQLAAFNYNKAKDLAEKERSNSGGGVLGTLWPNFLSCLAQLAAVEKLYMNLNLLNLKGFLRRENCVRASYESLLTDLTDLEVRAGGGVSAHQEQRFLSMSSALGAVGSVGATSRPGGVSNSIGEGSLPAATGTNTLLWNLCSELLSFIRARICLIKFYETCHQSSSSPGLNTSANCSSSSTTAGGGTGCTGLCCDPAPDYQDLAASVADIAATYADSFTQPLLTALRANLKYECMVLHSLLQGLHSIGQHSFLSALLRLDEAHDALQEWQHLSSCRESKKYSFGSSFLKGSSIPALLQWLWQLRAAATAKFSLYFYHSLAPQTSQADIRGLLARQPVDYVAKFVSFCSRVEASSVCVVLETSGIPSYLGPGYHLHQPSPSQPPSPAVPSHYCYSSSASSSIPPPPPPPPQAATDFTDSTTTAPVITYERIFCYPLLAGLSPAESARDAVCWNSLRHFLPQPLHVLPGPKDGVRQVYHHQTGYTHYLAPVEPLITLAVCYDCHRTERESLPVRRFLADTARHLGLGAVFAGLKPR